MPQNLDLHYADMAWSYKIIMSLWIQTIGCIFTLFLNVEPSSWHYSISNGY